MLVGQQELFLFATGLFATSFFLLWNESEEHRVSIVRMAMEKASSQADQSCLSQLFQGEPENRQYLLFQQQNKAN